jgi:hypothetical protein
VARVGLSKSLFFIFHAHFVRANCFCAYFYRSNVQLCAYIHTYMYTYRSVPVYRLIPGLPTQIHRLFLYDLKLSLRLNTFCTTKNWVQSDGGRSYRGGVTAVQHDGTS